MRTITKLAAASLAVALAVGIAARSSTDADAPLTLSNPNFPAPGNLLTVTIAEKQSLAVDPYGNVRLPNFDYAGFDSNLSVYGLSTVGNALYLTSDGGGGANDNVIIYPHGIGKVGVGTTNPQAKLDVNGFARLALNSAAPAACDESHEGSIALTHNSQVCVCDTTPAWHILNSGSPCAW
jgi:hypothetical protein